MKSRHPYDKLLNIMHKIQLPEPEKIVFDTLNWFDTRTHIKMFRDYDVNEDNQTGGQKADIYKVDYHGAVFKFHRHKDGKNVLSYNLYQLDDDNRVPECAVVFIDIKQKSAHIHEISQINECYNIKQVEILKKKNIKISGKVLVELAVKLIKMERPKYDIKYITLMDNSQKYCNGGNIQLGLMHTLLHGHTWYGTFGFKPANIKQNNVSNELSHAYDKNIRLMKFLKVRDVQKDLRKCYENANKKLNITIDIDSMINKHKNMLLCDYLEGIIMDYDKNCALFREIYLMLALDIGLTDFFGRTFILMLDKTHQKNNQVIVKPKKTSRNK
jgi:hypothetical protein